MINQQIVAVARGDEYQSTSEAIKLIKDRIITQLRLKEVKRIFLKPNWLKFRADWLPITKLDTLRALIDFLGSLGDFSFIVGDATPTVFGWDGKTFLRQANYQILEKEYPKVKVVDLNDFPAKKKFKAKTLDGERWVRIYKPVLETDFLVSVAKIKTHNTFANTLSLKNVAIGCAHEQDKALFHALGRPHDSREEKPDKQTWYEKVLPMVNYNFYQGSKAVYPDLAVIDGVIAMEGDGPSDGTPVNLGITLASLDALSADIVATKMMGFSLNEIPYLDILNNERKPQIKIIGESLDQFNYQFKPDQDYPYHQTTKAAVLKLINR